MQVNTTSETDDSQSVSRIAFVPSGEHSTENNAFVMVRHVALGVFIYRPDESITYPNADHLVSDVHNYIKVYTRRGGSNPASSKLADRPWHDPGPARWRSKKDQDEIDHEEMINERNPVA